MSKLRRFLLTLIPIGLVALCPLSPAIAADEDMVSQVYLEFDPETGEFKTAMDPTLTGKSQHQQAQSQQVEQIQQQQDSMSPGGAKAAAGTAASAPTAGGNTTTATGGDSMAAGNTTLWAGGLIVLGLVGGAVFLVRKNQHKTAS